MHAIQPRADQHDGVEVHVLVHVRKDGRRAPRQQWGRAVGSDVALHGEEREGDGRTNSVVVPLPLLPGRVHFRVRHNGATSAKEPKVML